MSALEENGPGLCGMIRVSPGIDGMGYERDCTLTAVGTTEDGVRVCQECANGMVKEGFRVDYDRSPQHTQEEEPRK